MTDQLDRIEAKLDRLQAALDRAGPLIDVFPDLLATVGNTFDDLAARDGNAQFDERLRRGAAVLLKLSDPSVLAAVERLLEHRATFATLADVVDELPGAAAAPIDRVGLIGLVRVLHEDEVQRALGFILHFVRRLGRVLDERDRTTT